MRNRSNCFGAFLPSPTASRSVLFMASLLLVVALLVYLARGMPCRSPSEAELSNETIRLKLGVSKQGVPMIEEANSVDGDQLFDGTGGADGLESWVPAELMPSGQTEVAWRVTEEGNFLRGEASRPLLRGLRMTWVAELAGEESLFRMHVRLKNTGTEPQEVKWFPGWSAAWNVTGGVRWVRYWRALEFQRIEEQLSPGKQVELGSRLDSSDDEKGGENPYWIIGGDGVWLHFGLEWCGGWEAELKRDNDQLAVSVRLPPRETQLKLKAGEAIEGPVVVVLPTVKGDEITRRHSWMMQRLELGQKEYGGPIPSFPMVYNHWYAARWRVGSEFLKRQVAAMAPYGFDTFVVDAGWSDRAGKWEPDPGKFEPGEFETILESARAQGIRVGLWSCPQFVSMPNGSLPEEAEEPVLFNERLDGYLLDLADADFTTRLTGHVTMLRDRHKIAWWKYDKQLFAEQSRAGLMKNVVAFQDALRAARRANPDLSIEGCRDGGRMINELTMLSSQTMWVRDAENIEGLAHARRNVQIALGALDFMFPWSVHQWTINLDQMGQNDQELTRFYCRSVMAGTWGVSSDLSRIGSAQRSVIVKEVRHYRQLNEIKRDCTYQLNRPAAPADVSGVTFYDVQQRRAGVLLYRGDREGQFDYRVGLKGLQPGLKYQVTDVDSGSTTEFKGKGLMRKGLLVHFTPTRLSALLFVAAVE